MENNNTTLIDESRTDVSDFLTIEKPVTVSPVDGSKLEEYQRLMIQSEKDRVRYQNLYLDELNKPEVVEEFRKKFDLLMVSSRVGNPWRFLDYIGYEKKVKLNPDGTERVRTRMNITPELEQKVKSLKEEGRTGKQIQKETGLSESSVSKILNGTRDIVGRN